MNLSRNSVRYCSAVVSAWIFLYVAFSGFYIMVSKQKPEMDGVQSYTDRENVILKKEFNFKSINILTIENEDYINRIIREVLEDNSLRSKNIDIKMNNDVNKGHDFQKKANRNDIQQQTNQNALVHPGHRLPISIQEKTSKNSRVHTGHWSPIHVRSNKSQRNTGDDDGHVPLDERTVENGMENKLDSVTGGNLQSIKQANVTAQIEIKMPKGTNNNETAGVQSSLNSENFNRSLKNNQTSYYNYSKVVITPMNAKFLISNENMCKDVTPDIVMLVPSSPFNTAKRFAIRNTYGTLSRDRIAFINGVSVNFVIKTVFLVGKSPSIQISKDVSDENKRYQDIIQIDFMDAYKQLTRKVLYGLKWINDFCPNVSYVMKVDDDVFVNTAILTHRLQEQPPRKNGSVFGHIYGGYRAVSRTGKWAVSYAEFPLPSFPDYMSGTSYVITSDLVAKILYTAQRLPYLTIEDAFITGVIANRLLGATMINWKDNSYWNWAVPNPCIFIKGHLSMTNATPQLIYDIWNTLASNGTKLDGTRCI